MVWIKLINAFKTASEVATNIITMGEYGRLRESDRLYEIAFRAYEASVTLFRTKEDELKSSIQQFDAEVKNCIELLNDVKNFIERLTYSEVSSTNLTAPILQHLDLSQVDRMISDFSVPVELGKGAGIGLATSAATWVLVS